MHLCYGPEWYKSKKKNILGNALPHPFLAVIFEVWLFQRWGAYQQKTTVTSLEISEPSKQPEIDNVANIF